jgi:hypothetical protein
MEHCCHSMANSVATLEEKRANLDELGISRDQFPDPLPEPIVCRGDQGVYIIGHVAISYCPWCGAKLPEFSIEKAREQGYEIHYIDRDFN